MPLKAIACMNVTVELQNNSGSRKVPLRRQFTHWASTAMARITRADRPHHLSILIVDEAESARLNGTWRMKQGATNVLSFPLPADAPHSTAMGDLAICAQVVHRESAAQQKPLEAHWAHLTVHGVLHLNGYDHEIEEEAQSMEKLETSIMKQLGYQDPYQPLL
jgi:probable rRNA maturation factor